MHKIHIIVVTARVVITAPPAITAMSQTGRATVLLMYKFAFLFSDEVVTGSVATVTTSVTDLCAVSLEGLVLFDTVWNLQ